MCVRVFCGVYAKFYYWTREPNTHTHTDTHTGTYTHIYTYVHINTQILFNVQKIFPETKISERFYSVCNCVSHRGYRTENSRIKQG